MKKVIVVGLGLSERDLTAEHLETIRRADILVGSRRQLAAFEDFDVPKREIGGNVAEVVEFIRSQMGEKRIVVLASGDPLFFGIGGRICRELGPEHVCVQPNISSIAGAFARLRLPWGEARIVSLHGRDRLGDLLQALRGDKPVAVLTDPRQTPQWLAKQLMDKGIRGVKLAVCEQLGAPGEKFSWYRLEEAAAGSFAQPNVVILTRVPDKALPSCQPYLGMSEMEYHHEQGLITKSEIRAVVLAKLRLSPGLTLWDLGAGSGAVGIEASVLLGSGRIMAVERDPARVDQIRKNAERFCVSNLEVVHGGMPGALNGLPSPDRVFIGGGGRDLEAIITAAAERLPPEGVMVVNTVLIANLQAAIDVMARSGLEVQVAQVQISCGKAMPWDQRLEARNPVWIVSGVRSPAVAGQSQLGALRRPHAARRTPIIFCGAGPGDPELITVKGRRALETAELILYTGSLVPEAVLSWAKPAAERISSAAMTLEQIVDTMAEAYQAGRQVVRLHTGDPSLYGAIMEQMAALRARSIPCRVIPGVTAAFAAAAALGVEYTLPEVTQTLILTRLAGRTAVPEAEALESLARHRSSMVIYLSMAMIDEVSLILSRAYGADAPCAIAYRVSQPEEQILPTTTVALPATARQAGITRHAVIMVGPAMEHVSALGTLRSRLYDKDFSHGCRQS